MAKRRIERKNDFTYGAAGDAKFTKLDNHRARIEVKNKEGNLVGTYQIEVKQGNPFEDETATLPEYFPWSALRENGSINVRVRLNETNTKVMNVNPLSGEFQVEFVGFKKTNDKAVIEEKIGKGGKPYGQFSPFMEVTEGRWKGCRFMGFLYDNFGKDPDDGNLTVLGSGTGSDNLADFMDCLGYEYWTQPYSENPLPAIEEFAEKSPRKFKIIVVNGWVSNYIAGFDEEAFGDVEEERLDSVSNPQEEVNELLQD